ncbi:MAG: 16S rRNA (guanine(527)-N(7))-methyltransferase RsmG [Myxococcaceae bacterium]
MTAWRRRDTVAWAERLRGEGLAEGLAGALASYLALLGQWGAAVDLLGEMDEKELLAGHVHEALAALPWLGEEGTLLDVGSGNGFPAVPLLLARPRMRGVLLEPRERRWAFLREVVRELGLAADVVRSRAKDHAGSGYAALTVRGVEMGEWLPHTRRLLDGEGTLLWWTSAANAEELGRRVPEGRVLTFPLPDPTRGKLAVWRRCFT